jgi:hypothetical protein
VTKEIIITETMPELKKRILQYFFQNSVSMNEEICFFGIGVTLKRNIRNPLDAADYMIFLWSYNSFILQPAENGDQYTKGFNIRRDDNGKYYAESDLLEYPVSWDFLDYDEGYLEEIIIFIISTEFWNNNFHGTRPIICRREIREKGMNENYTQLNIKLRFSL